MWTDVPTDDMMIVKIPSLSIGANVFGSDDREEIGINDSK